MNNFEPNNEQQLRQYAIVTYALYGLSLFFGITLFAGVIVAYVQRNAASGSIYASHFQYLIRTFWVLLFGCIVGILLSLILIGYLILFAVGAWFIYRMIMGVLRLYNNQEANTQTWF